MDDALRDATDDLIRVGIAATRVPPTITPSYREPRPLYERYTEYGEPPPDPVFARMVRLMEMMKDLNRREVN